MGTLDTLQVLKDENNKDIVQIVAFDLVNETYAVEIKYVHEIIRIPDITDVPHTAKYILGVINLRGQIIPVIDLRIKFGLAGQRQTNSSRIIVVKINEDVVGMHVDAVSEVISLNRSAIEPTSPVIASIDSDYLQGVGKVGDKMILLLDITKTVTRQLKHMEYESDVKLIKLAKG